MIPATRRSAAPCCGHIEVAASRGAAIAAAAWLGMLCLVTLVAVSLPLLARIATCVAIATPGIVAIRTVFLLRSPRSVCALAWSGPGQGFHVLLKARGRKCPAELAGGSFRIGSRCLLLRLRTCDGLLAVFIDGNRQEVSGFRRLCRRLQWPSRDP